MKTDKQIWKEWQTKDDMGMRYTLDDRVILAMREFAKQDTIKIIEKLQSTLNNIEDENFWGVTNDLIEKYKIK